MFPRHFELRFGELSHYEVSSYKQNQTRYDIGGATSRVQTDLGKKKIIIQLAD